MSLSAIASFAILTPPASASPSLRPGGTPVDGQYYVLAGSLHDHSFDSDGHATAEDISAWEYAHRYELGLDFADFTEHSDTFPFGANSTATLTGSCSCLTVNNSQTANLVWPHQAQVDSLYTGGVGGFTLMRGFEFTDDQENHLNVIGSQNWVQPGVINEGVPSMLPFYTWISTPPTIDTAGTGIGYGGADGVGQFNHPDSKGALNWDDYAFNATAAPFMKTIEIFGNQAYPGGLNQSDGGWYWFALSQGWTLSPTEDWDNHYWEDKIATPTPGSNCGSGSYLPCERTLVFATTNSQAGIMDALRNHRTAATQFPGLWASVKTQSGTFMGSTIVAQAGQTIPVVIHAGSDINALTSFDIVSDNGVNPFPYYYGDNVACNATPIPYGGNLNPNCLPEELGETSLAPSYILQHEKYVSTGGHATKKQIIDTPPANTTLASYRLSGHSASITVDVTVPTAASLRPDGEHFFYVVAHAADGSRVWTAPIFISSGAANPNSSALKRKPARHLTAPR